MTKQLIPSLSVNLIFDAFLHDLDYSQEFSSGFRIFYACLTLNPSLLPGMRGIRYEISSS